MKDCLPRCTWPTIESSFFIATACKLPAQVRISLTASPGFPMLTGHPNFFVHDGPVDNSTYLYNTVWRKI